MIKPEQPRHHLTVTTICVVVLGVALAFEAKTAHAGFVPNPAHGIVDLNAALANTLQFPLVIDVPGTYQLTTNLDSMNEPAIVIALPSPGLVTLQLNGLSIIGTGSDGVKANAGSTIAILNGTIQNFDTGVDATSASCIIHGVRIVGGAHSIGRGMRCGNKSSITGNTVIISGANRAQGIATEQAIISNNIVSGWSTGILVGGDGSTISGNSVSNNIGDGIDCGSSYVSGNTVTNNEGSGILDTDFSVISNNTVSQNRKDGIHGSASTILGNTVNSNGGIGIADVASSIANNTVTNNAGDGIAGDRSNITNNNVFANLGTGVDDRRGLANGNTVTGNKGVGLNFSDANVNYINNSVGNNNSGGANVVNGTSRGGNLCYQGPVTTACP